MLNRHLHLFQTWEAPFPSKVTTHLGRRKNHQDVSFTSDIPPFIPAICFHCIGRNVDKIKFYFHLTKSHIKILGYRRRFSDIINSSMDPFPTHFRYNLFACFNFQVLALCPVSTKSLMPFTCRK